jgi:hypothetical protein
MQVCTARCQLGALVKLSSPVFGAPVKPSMLAHPNLHHTGSLHLLWSHQWRSSSRARYSRNDFHCRLQKDTANGMRSQSIQVGMNKESRLGLAHHTAHGHCILLHDFPDNDHNAHLRIPRRDY